MSPPPAGGAILTLKESVQLTMRHGGSIDAVDADIIEPSTLDADQKAALWLYAWSYLPPRRQRDSAEALLRTLTVRRNRGKPGVSGVLGESH